MIRVLLISIYSDIQCVGLRSITAYLKEYGDGLCTVKQLFLPQDTNELLKQNNLNILRGFINNNFDIIGISVMSNYFKKARLISEEIRKISNATIIWGGIHPTVCPEECLKYCDAVCIGEGEEPLLGMIRKMATNQSYQDEENLAFIRGGKLILNEIRKPIEDLDIVPPLDYDSNTSFVLLNGYIRNMTNEILESYMGNNFTTITSRGCIYKCYYCCNNALSGISKGYNKVRRQSCHRVINDLVNVKNSLNFIEHITFDDDDFLSADVDKLRLFSELYKKNVNLPFYITGVIPSFVSEEKLKILINAGLRNIKVGIQSASERIYREIYNRPYTVEKMKDSIEIIDKFKKSLRLPRYDIILDNPWEAEHETIENINFLNNLPRPFVLNKFSLTFYPGTALFKKAMEENIIKNVEKEIYEHNFKHVKNNFLNFLVYIIPIVRIPNPILIMLLYLNKKGFIKKMPYFLFVFLDTIDVMKRHIFVAQKFKVRIFLNGMKYSLRFRQKS